MPKFYKLKGQPLPTVIFRGKQLIVFENEQSAFFHSTEDSETVKFLIEYGYSILRPGEYIGSDGQVYGQAQGHSEPPTPVAPAEEVAVEEGVEKAPAEESVEVPAPSEPTIQPAPVRTTRVARK